MTRFLQTNDQELRTDQSVAASTQDNNPDSPEKSSARLRVDGATGGFAELSVQGRLSTRLLAMSVPLFSLGLLVCPLTPFD